MKKTSTLVLPGLDGTDLLLGRFCELAPKSRDVTVWTLPDNQGDDYSTLCTYFSDRIQALESRHLVAESFSGPLGILLAHRHPEIVRRLTLVATFATSPAPFLAGILPWKRLFRFPMPAFIARRYFAGRDNTLVSELKNTIRQTSPETLARRLRCLMKVDVSAELSELHCKLSYIRPKQDRLVPNRSLTKILDLNRAVSVSELDGPHLIMQTMPRQVWRCLQN